MPSPSTDIYALVEAGLPHVDRIARNVAQSMHHMVEREDLRQVGTVALMEAAYRYDPSRNVPFEIWAMRRVRGAMIDGLAALTGFSRTHVKQITNYNAEQRASTLTTERLRKTLKLFTVPGSNEMGGGSCPLVYLVGGEAGEELLDRKHQPKEMADPAYISLDKEAWEVGISALEGLSAEERDILTQHYLEERPLAQIAVDMGVSRSWVSRLHKRALARAQRFAKEISKT